MRYTMTAPPTLQDPIMREIASTLDLLDETRKKVRRDEVPAWLWLRAARSCWLTANMDRARDFYKHAATGLLDVALESGHRTGTFEQYAHLAIGAAWMADDQDLLAETGRQIERSAEHQLANVDNPPDALTRAVLTLTRLRVAWFRGQTAHVKELEPEIERRIVALDAWGKAFWIEERGAVSHGFIKALLAIKPEPIRLALQNLDTRIGELRVTPPTVNDLVDEEFVSFAAAMADYRIPLPRVATPTTPGRFA